jgi:hypothetical protein
VDGDSFFGLRKICSCLLVSDSWLLGGNAVMPIVSISEFFSVLVIEY